MRTRLILAFCLLCFAINATAQQTDSFSGSAIADEGAWCWFADPRAIHYKSADGEIDAAYIGYIDVHGAIKKMKKFSSDEAAWIITRYFLTSHIRFDDLTLRNQARHRLKILASADETHGHPKPVDYVDEVLGLTCPDKISLE